MSDYTANTTLNAIADRLRAAARVMIATHAKPDGDAYGSVVALGAALRSLDKQVDIPLIAPLPEQFRQLKGYELVRVYDGSPPAFEPDVIVVTDTGAWQQLPELKPYIQPRLSGTIVIDHHLSGDMQVAWRYIDSQAASCCEVIWQLLDGVLFVGDRPPADPWAQIIHEALFVGIASDTGWFRFSNTRPLTHELAADLIRRGVDHSRLYQKLEMNERPEKLALMIRALDSLRMVAGGRAAVMVLGPDDFNAVGAIAQDTERFVDMPQIVGTIQVVALVTHPPGDDGPVRISFRSKPGEGAVNVAELAHQFGGGGHARAAGAKVRGRLQEVAARVCRALERALIQQAV